ncbi:MAG: hypothetical protein JW798_11230 [Prolixibacteraceae bacterium]|nr:hypothetical protein [Prolixibacteraceae bacterium]
MLKVFIYILLLLSVIPHAGICRSNVFPSSARATGMGNAFISIEGIESVFHNQAGFTTVKKLSVLLGYENRFGIKELSQPYALVAIVTKSGNFGLHFSTLGPSGWLETRVSLAYAKKISPRLSAGLQFNYFSNILPEENQRLISAGFEVGALYAPTKKIKIGAHVANPWSLPLKTLTYKETIPWVFRIGAHTTVSNNVLVSAEIEKTSSLPINIKGGIEWEALPDMFFRMGANSQPATFFAGLGYSYSFITANLAMCFHQRLGYTTGISLLFDFE